jgi:hypothetical protein
MFKLLIALSLFIAIQAQVGDFHDRPDLVRDPKTVSMVRLAVAELESSQNLHVLPHGIVSVATQVVNGINYRIVFTARNPSTNGVLSCTTTAYQSLDGAQSVSSVSCNERNPTIY